MGIVAGEQNETGGRASALIKPSKAESGAMAERRSRGTGYGGGVSLGLDILSLRNV